MDKISNSGDLVAVGGCVFYVLNGDLEVVVRIIP